MRGRGRFVSSTAVGLLLLSAAGRVAAQPAAEPPANAAYDAAPVPAEAAPTAAAAADARADEPWTAYHQAFEALVVGDRARARQLLDALVLLHPNHPAAARARALAAALGPPSWSPPTAAVRDRNATTNSARAELIVFQTIHGVLAGVELCAAAECAGVRPTALSLMAMGGLGLGLSVGFSRGGMRPGETAALDTGTFWGAWNGLAASEASSASARGVVTSMLVGQLLGLSVGGGLGYAMQPTSGQVALASTFGIWSTELTFSALLAFSDGSQSAQHLWAPMLIAGDLGFVVGVVVARGSSISRGRAALIDVGGVLGALLGGLVASGASGSNATNRAGVSLMVGTGLGLGLAAFATSNWDAPAGVAASSPSRASGWPTALNLAPFVAPRGGTGVALGGAF
jgi:hypothetical protein